MGLLRLEQALGALIYHAEEAARAKAELPVNAPPVFVLEGSRLTPKGVNPSPATFDNRFFHAYTDFPAAEALKARQITRIYYVSHTRVMAYFEEDDLNEYFQSLGKAGISFTHVRVGVGTYEEVAVKPAPRATIFTPVETARYASTRPYGSHYHNYHNHHFWAQSRGSWGSGTGGSSSRGFSS